MNNNLHFIKIPNDSHVLYGLERTYLYKNAIVDGLGRKVWREFKSRGSKEPLHLMQSRKWKEDLKGESGLGSRVVK